MRPCRPPPNHRQDAIPFPHEQHGLHLEVLDVHPLIDLLLDSGAPVQGTDINTRLAHIDLANHLYNIREEEREGQSLLITKSVFLSVGSANGLLALTQLYRPCGSPSMFPLAVFIAAASRAASTAPVELVGRLAALRACLQVIGIGNTICAPYMRENKESFIISDVCSHRNA